MNIKSLIKLKSKEFIYGRAGAIPREMSNTEAFHKGYQLAIKDVEKLECMKSIEHEDWCLVNEDLPCDCGIDDVNRQINHIKQQLQSLLKNEKL
jgi:hypothetical protein